MDIREWLDSYKKVNELINGKQAEKKQLLEECQRLIDIATDISAKMPDGMPHSNLGTVVQKMQNAVVSKIIVDEEIESVDNAISVYLELKKAVITAIEKLPAKEYGVIHRYYIRGMTYEKIAEDLGISTVQVWRIKKKGEKTLSEIIERMQI